MRSVARSYSGLQGQEQPEQKPLQFRNVALLYPGKEVLERIRRHGDDNAPIPRYIKPMFDEDDDKCSPLAPNEQIRVLIAQDDTGVSLSRLLFDSHAVKPNVPPASQQTPKILSFHRSPSPAEASHSSGFIRHQQQPRRTAQDRVSFAQPKLDGASEPSPTSTFFGQSAHTRRMPAYVSLADARNDPQVPIENTKEEMDSWLDCVFGKGQLRYRGDNTKIHTLERQPADPKLAHWEKEAQRGGFELCPQRNSPLPRSKPAELIKLRKSTLLVSRTFTIPMHHEDLPEDIRQLATSGPGPMTSRFNKPPKSHWITPTFAVAILLPLRKTLDDDEATESPSQLALDNWHIIERALDALEASAALHIQRQLSIEVEAMAKASGKSLFNLARKLRLRPNALQNSGRVVNLSEFVSARIARGFRIPYVSTRGEWNIWRDELRESSRNDKGIDIARVNFIQLALTAALSSNLSWMRTFAPPALQVRLRYEARMLEDEYSEAQNRTIVTTTDHNKARQIIYILSKFMPSTQPVEDFSRSATNTKTPGRVSALTQGLKAVSQQPPSLKPDDHTPRGPTISIGAPVFSLPLSSAPGASPVKVVNMSPPRTRSPSKCSLQRTKTRIDVQGKGTPAMPIASAPGSSWTTPAVSPDARPSSSASAQDNLMRQLQRNNSALSETSTESGSFWNSLRSTSWTWGLRRESGATSVSEGGTGICGSQRGDAPAGILKTGKSSFSRGTSKKLVRMVEENEQAQPHRTSDEDRKDSGMPTPTALQPASKSAPPAFSQMLEYTYNSVASVVDVGQLSEGAGVQSCNVPVSHEQFPTTEEEGLTTSESLVTYPASNVMYDRVAGFLDRLHPDFALQAVKPYRQLEYDLKLSMQGERSPKHGLTVSDPDFFPQEHWIDVCSTVIVDADTMVVKRLTLRRHVRYSLTMPDVLPETAVPNTSGNTIKVTKSEEMDSVKRTYRRNDDGNKVDWKDKRVVLSGNDGQSGSGSGETSMTNSCEQIPVASTGMAIKEQTRSDPMQPDVVAVGSTGTAFKHSIANYKPPTVESVDTWLPKEDEIDKVRHGDPNPVVGDDLTAFIDVNAKANNKPKPSRPVANSRRVPVRNRDGKITGWKEMDEDEHEEPGLRDLPATFVDSKREQLRPIIHERTLDEVFDEETLHNSDHSIVTLLEQMLASTDIRSTVPSRAGSTHERMRSRSNSICGSGLAELQHESKKIVGDLLEGLVMSIGSEGQSPSRLSGGFFKFRRGGQVPFEDSVLRQSISKWLTEG